ncbi:type II toxin-antitoxin system RelE/ParE family toxin [Moheibacter sp.]|uniref:type II toxin-antitoxin system RelE/ParE family toxin n=1 Tax=Moheibacter sp. TaxID=1965316 RepID=UPI003C750EF3
MSYKILITSKFEKELKRLSKKISSLKNEYREFLSLVSENPELGTFIGNNCYKIRLAIASEGKGKRGGARIITYVYHSGETVYLLTIYDKSEKEDLTEKELNKIISQLDLGEENE